MPTNIFAKLHLKRKPNVQAKRKTSILSLLQTLGKSLIYPIAILPFAALLNRLGSLGITFAAPNSVGYWISWVIQQPGAVVFNNIAVFFGIGVAFGIAKDNRGEAALIGYFFYIILVAFTAKSGLGDLFYSNVLTSQNIDAQGNVVTYSNLMYVWNGSTKTADYVLDIGVFGGITAGAMSAFLYNRLKLVKLPQALSFFGGRRFVPMVAGLTAMVVAFLFAAIWPWIQYVLVRFGDWLGSGTDVEVPGAFLYGVVNRFMQPFGLHHILNTFLWFQLPVVGPQIQPITGNIINDSINNPITIFGDINAYNLAGGPLATSGLFQSGYFPVFFGGEPAAAVAMIYAIKAKQQRKEMATFFGGVAAVAFLTGIDEPLVFSFLFISPLLWSLYALWTGVGAAIVIAMQIRLGFGFSAGFIDYAISIPNAWGVSNFIGTPAATQFGYWGGNLTSKVLSNPLWIFPISAFSFFLFYTSFYFSIMLFDIKTPGRETENVLSNFFIKTRTMLHMKPYAMLTEEQMASHKSAALNYAEEKENPPEATVPVTAAVPTTNALQDKKPKTKEDIYKHIARLIVEGVGADNFVSVNNCSTRLRLIVKDNSPDKIDDAKIKSGRQGLAVVRLKGKDTLQVIVGTDVEFAANEVKDILTAKGKNIN